MTTDVIGIPLGTRLEQIVLHNGEVHVWIAVKCRDPDYTKWQGTYLAITSNGEVTRITEDDEYNVLDIFTIKEGN